MTLDQLFGVTGHVNWQQECARAVVIFLYGLVVVRLAGRRIFAQWSALDIVIAILMGSSLSRALTGNADLFGTLGAMTLLIGLHWLFAQAVARSVKMSALLEGRPVRLAGSGQINRRACAAHGVSAGDLAEALRTSGLDDGADVAVVTLEPSGKITVVRQP